MSTVLSLMWWRTWILEYLRFAICSATTSMSDSAYILEWSECWQCQSVTKWCRKSLQWNIKQGNLRTVESFQIWLSLSWALRISNCFEGSKRWICNFHCSLLSSLLAKMSHGRTDSVSSLAINVSPFANFLHSLLQRSLCLSCIFPQSLAGNFLEEVREANQRLVLILTAFLEVSSSIPGTSNSPGSQRWRCFAHEIQSHGTFSKFPTFLVRYACSSEDCPGVSFDLKSLRLVRSLHIHGLLIVTEFFKVSTHLGHRGLIDVQFRWRDFSNVSICLVVWDSCLRIIWRKGWWEIIAWFDENSLVKETNNIFDSRHS